MIHRIFVRRARCERCGTGEALLPDFVLRRRLDSAAAVGAAVLAHGGQTAATEATALYAAVPARTVRSWCRAFSERAEELTTRLAALCVEWGGELPRDAPTLFKRAMVVIGAVWRVSHRRHSDQGVPPPWQLANLIVGGQLISTRVDLPWPFVATTIERAQGP